MRILAIRGENLASLAGRFEVDLEKPPLGGVGLFAITGATGAGKSTLLDAMCVALFDKTPRLEKSGGVLVGRADDDPKARLPSNDVRALLRRGAGSGFAEVDYLGRDGRRYRATWRVRRARDSASGAYQLQEMNLVDLATGESQGRNRTEVGNAIRQTLGLSYEQFRRSALLAQGDFAAFLKANSDERAGLLEQMTGTELYSAISKQAHLAHKEAQKRLADLQAESGAVQVLSPDSRAALEGEIVASDAAKKAAAEDKTRIEGAVRWFDALTHLRGREEEASRAKQAAALAHADAWPQREELAQVDAAAAHRPALVAAEEADAAHIKALTALEARSGEASEATRLHAEANAALVTQAGAYEQAFAAREAARPLLDEATALDQKLEDGGARRDGLIRAEQDAAGALREAQQEITALQGKIAEAETLAGSLTTWLTEHAALAPLVDAWSRCEPALKRYAEAATDGKNAAATRPRLLEAQARAASARDAAAGAVTAARGALGVAEEASRAANDEEMRAAVTEEMRVERAQIGQRLKGAGQFALIIEQVDALRVSVAHELGSAADARAQALAAAGEAKERDDEAARKQAALDEAERALERARATRDLADHRAALRDDEPCPLCGATDHPYAREAGPLAGLVTEAELRVRELRLQREDCQKRAATCRAHAGEREAAAVKAGQGAEKAREEIARLTARWQRETAALGVEAQAPDAEGHAAVQAAIQAAEARQSAIVAAEEQAAALSTRARSLQTARDARRGALDKAELALAAATTGLADAARKLEQGDEASAQAARDLARALDDLAPALVAHQSFEAALAADPPAFAARCAADVATYRDKSTQRASWDKAKTDLAALQGAARAKADERQIVAEKSAQERAAEDAVLSRLRAQRAALLEGQPTEAVRSALDAKVKQAGETRDAAQRAERTRAEQATTAETEAKAAAEALRERADVAERTRKALAAALDQAGIDLATLKARLAHDPGWITATRADLDRRKKALDDSDAVLGERIKARAEHEGKDAPSLTEDEARARLVPADDAFNAATTAFAEARERCRADDAARDKVQGKAAALEACRKDAEHWQAVDALIGSADGKKFRVFAQSLTLEALLSHANEHLGDFAPRYRLMRVPGQDLDLQIIDQDMGDEVRSVNSLSGGESFLVSLALALGLSSLAARDVRVETLFIDEGFGTLDPETLDVALAALDALQSSGRQIGLISHVSGLAEQIGAQVHLQKLGGGRSQIVIEGVTAPAGAALGPDKAKSPTRAKKKKAPSPNEPTLGE